MAETLAQFLVDFFDDKISAELIAFIVSLLPVLELRGGLIAARIMQIEFVKAFAICYIGNMLPIPFILLFIRKIFNFLKRFEKVESVISKLEARSIRKGNKVEKYRLLGLFIFVATPLPGTGAWTGALIADLFDIRLKHSFPVIAIGVLIAGIIVSFITYGLFSFA